MKFSSSIHLFENDKISFFLWLQKADFINPFTGSGNFGCIHTLAIVNSAAINMGVQVPLE
jgi:hypothetical protein